MVGLNPDALDFDLILSFQDYSETMANDHFLQPTVAVQSHCFNQYHVPYKVNRQLLITLSNSSRIRFNLCRRSFLNYHWVSLHGNNLDLFVGT